MRSAFEPVELAKTMLTAEAVVGDLTVVVAMLVRLGRHVHPAGVYRDAMQQLVNPADMPFMPATTICSMSRLDLALNRLNHC
ncbi:MAG: hypothetical protein R8K50_05990 [Mariprofundus sp.]